MRSYVKKKIIKARLDGNEELAKLLEIEEKLSQPIRCSGENAEKNLKKEVETLSDSIKGRLEELRKTVMTKSPACRLDNEPEKECVKRKVPELIDEGYSKDQAVAIANSMCSIPCSEKKEKIEIDWERMPKPGEVEVTGFGKLVEYLKKKLDEILKVEVQNDYLRIRFVKKVRDRLEEVEPEDVFRQNVVVSGGGISGKAQKNLEDLEFKDGRLRVFDDKIEIPNVSYTWDGGFLTQKVEVYSDRTVTTDYTWIDGELTNKETTIT